MQIQRRAPGFPMSHLHPSHCGKSPILSSSSPRQRPWPKSSVPWSGISSLCPSPGNLALFLSVIPSYAAVPRLLLGAYVWSPPTATSAARATWLLWREKAPTGLASQCYQEREREGHQVLFQNNQSTSQAFAGFG